MAYSLGKLIAPLASTATLALTSHTPAFAAASIPFKGNYSGTLTFTGAATA